MTSGQQGYYRMPTIHEDRVVFVCEDDLWEVSRSGGRATRLTSGQGEISWPSFSPDGSAIALVSQEEGGSDVYVMPSYGGPLKRVTFDEQSVIVVGWNAKGTAIIFSSARQSAHRSMQLFEVDVTTTQTRQLGVGDGVWHSASAQGQVVGRHRYDMARWKRYRGGLAGELWVQRKDTPWTRLFKDESAGSIRPMWLGDRIYFVSDREGHANIYSCTPDGEDVTRHTDHIGFYVRATQTDGRHIIYTCGADLYTLNLHDHTVSTIDVEFHSPRTQLRRKFVDAEDYVESYALHPDGHHLSLTVRGKAYNFGLWEGAVRQTGEPHGVRYRLSDYMPDGERIVVLSDAHSGRERLEYHEPFTGAITAIDLDLDFGRVVDLKVSPHGEQVAIANHRQELWYVDLATGKGHMMGRSAHARITDFNWSPDARWVVYAAAQSGEISQLLLHEIATQTSHVLTDGEFNDSDPVFDPEGRYIYFVSYRTFNPVYGNLFFELGLTRGQHLCLITLQAKLESPFIEKPRALDDKEDDDKDDKEDKDDDKRDEPTQDGEAKDAQEEEAGDDAPKPVEIELEGIASRVMMFPIGESKIEQVEATVERVYFVTQSPRGSIGEARRGESSSKGVLRYWCFDDRKLKMFHADVSGFTLSHDMKTLALWSQSQLRVVSASGSEPDDDDDDEACNRKTGWIDLGRVSVEVLPTREWEQMLAEAWRLMDDDFWREGMSGVDWDEVYARYAPLVSRVGSRAEFSDLVWTMQGELGTSHTYEFGGDYRQGPAYSRGYLGADLLWDASAQRGPAGEESKAQGAYRISTVLQGDTWSAEGGSPLGRPGVNVKEGDLVLALDAQVLDAEHGPDARLVNKAGQEVELVLYTPGDEATRRVTIKTLASDSALRYRHWVRARRAQVHERTGGAVGYVHIPDMGPAGYAEFHRAYAAERRRSALIVDVRFNGGGHVSSLILEKLARKPLGFDVSRHGELLTYPQEGPSGPLVALTNEYAGSDGDIFSHGFKMMGLGPLMGRRTWGGVIGIWPRHALVDGSVTTQPAFSFWFHDVGFTVENYGTEPDVVIDDSPEAQAEGDDVQLEAAIVRALDEIESNAQTYSPPESFEPYPDMTPPKSLGPQKK